MILPGLYVKDDGGVRFKLSRDGDGFWFDHTTEDGELHRQAARLLVLDCGEHSSPCLRHAFTITWEWGSPTFVATPDGHTLVENDEHVFKLCAARRLTAEQIFSFRDVGHVCMHDALQPSPLLQAALESEDVQRAIAASKDGPAG